MTIELHGKINETCEIKVLVGLINHFLDHANFFGIDRQTLLLHSGLTEKLLHDSNQCIALHYLEKLVAYTYSICNDPLIVLAFFKKMDSTAYGVLGHLVPLSANLNKAIETLKEFQPLIGCIGDISLQVSPEIVYWKWKCRSNDPIFSRCANEYNLLWWISLINLVRSENFPILKAVNFTHNLPKPELQKYYDEFFGCPVHFNQQETALLLHPKSLNMTLKTGNAGLYDSVRLFASKLLEQQKLEQTFIQQVKSQIYLLLSHDRLSRENVAEQLGITVRTLSRKLQLEQSSYSDLLDKVRFELAVNYLENYRHSILFIAKALGFYTSHSFITWFKLQTNLTPNQYRKNSKEKMAEA